MNILVVSPQGLYHNYSFSFVHNQAKTFAALGHRVRAVVLIAIGKCTNEGKRFGSPVEMVLQDGVEICYVRHLSLSNYGGKSFNVRSAAWSCKQNLSEILRGFSPDVVYGHTVHFGSDVGKIFAEHCCAPLVLTTHGGDTNVYIQQGREEVLRECCDRASAVMACSNVLKNRLQSCGTITQVGCIWNGFSTENVQVQKKISHRIVQANTLNPSKHTEHTIRAVAQLKQSYPDITLIVVGGGPERERLEELCKELNVAECVTFLGWRTNAETLAEMAAAEIFCMPSYPEGFGIVYLEAMASGCVTIGTQGEGIDGVIVDGENGFLVSRDDVNAIVAVIDCCFRDNELEHRVANAGRSTAMELTWEKNAKEYLAVFASRGEENAKGI